MNQILEDIQEVNQPSTDQEQESSDEPEKKNLQQKSERRNETIKMMDTITFSDNFKPKWWVFTDLVGRIQFKDISSISISDVIKAFLVNMSQNKAPEFTNDDLVEFL